ncbi:MAG TPA: TMEM175 family protein [Xanthomonadales bacterium]|nr:TMEM175 family protein [Xanthomonadales bacterium]
MQPLTQQFLDDCPQEGGFRLRGSEMTRIEVFVDAAFAFAVTLLVISFDAIPRTFDEMVIAIKTIPAFVAAVVQLVWIWQTHATWSKRYGLDDGATVWLSALLLIVMLVYIYPMRILLEGAFNWASGGYLPSSFELANIEELRFMFAFMGAAFGALCLTFVLLYRYALRQSDTLLLNAMEQGRTRKVIKIWTGCMLIGFALVALSMLLPQSIVSFSGFVLGLIGVWVFFVESRHRNAEKSEEHQS